MMNHVVSHERAMMQYWCMALDKRVSERSPDGRAPYRTNHYPKVCLTQHRTRIDTDGAASVWSILVHNADDLRYSPAMVTVPLEDLARQCAKKWSTVKDHVDDLKQLGLVRTERRVKKTSIIRIFLTPQLMETIDDSGGACGCRDGELHADGES
jgi:hypothetical protein